MTDDDRPVCPGTDPCPVHNHARFDRGVLTTGDDPATVFIQWKGTDVCLDFYCQQCGMSSHYDGDFAYSLRCVYCDAVFAMPHSLPLVLTTDPAEVGRAQLTERDDPDEVPPQTPWSFFPPNDPVLAVELGWPLSALHPSKRDATPAPARSPMEEALGITVTDQDRADLNQQMDAIRESERRASIDGANIRLD